MAAPTIDPPAQPAPKTDPRREAVSSWITGLGDAADDKGVALEQQEPPPKPQEQPVKAQEPPKAPEKAAEPSDTVEDKWPRSSSDWKKFIEVRNDNYKKRDERINALEKERKELESKLAGFSNAVDPKEYESVKGERDKLSETLRLAAVEKHPRFNAYYENKTNAQLELAKRIAGKERADAIVTLLKSPDTEYRAGQLEALMTEMSPLQQSRLGGVLNALEDIRTERETEIGRAREDYDKALAKQTAEQKAAGEKAKADADGIFNATMKALQDPKEGNPIFQLKENDAEWNKGVSERVEAAKSILFGQHKPDELVRYAFNATAYPVLLQAHRDLLAEVDKLQAQLKQMSGASPTVNGRPQTPGAKPAPKPGSRPMEVVKDWMGDLASEE